MGAKQGYKIAVLILSLLVIIESAALIFLLASRRTAIKKIPKAALPLKGKIAIVIDDWGYNLNNFPVLKQIKYPLTLAVLPNLVYSHKISQEAQRLGFEIILHLPMEPLEKFKLEETTITTDMDEQVIINILSRDFESIPHLKGISNHMGSKATRDIRVMSIIFTDLKKRGLYFLDSYVTPSLVCADLADQMHIRFAKRDVFLDIKEDPVQIMKQINKLKTRANLYGRAIGIGHDRGPTLRVLKEVMPKLEKEGYRFVFVSELLK